MSFDLLTTLFYAIHIKRLYFDILITIFVFYFDSLIYEFIINLRKSLRLFVFRP